MYNDATSGLIWVENQVSLGANKTVIGESYFQQWLLDQCVSKVKHYHCDNAIFSAEKYRRDCEGKGLSRSFSGVGTQHQNACAERLFKQSCIWHRLSWFTPHSIGHIVDLSGPLW